MNFGGESVGVVTQGVFDLPEDPFGWRVRESLGHFAGSLFQERTQAIQQLLDTSFAVAGTRRCGRAGVGHDSSPEGILLDQQ